MKGNSVLMLAICAGFCSVVYLGSTGCHDDHDHDDDGHTHTDAGGHTSQYPDCQVIIDKCHPLDTGEETKAHECHDLAHGAKSNADCTAKKAECLAGCVEPTDAGDGGGGHSHDEDAGEDAGDGG